MAVNFAPYQSSTPEIERVRSPPLRSPTASPRPTAAPARQQSRAIASVADNEDPWAAARAQQLPAPSRYADDEEDGGYTNLEGSGPLRINDYIAHGRAGVGGWRRSDREERGGSVFETSLGIPLHVEASLAYLVLPPAGGVALLLLERKSDYVRFHAWQSTLVFGVAVLVHIIFSWTAVLSWILFVGDLALMAYLTYGAWQNADTLDRVEAPILGRIASSFVDEE